MNSNDFRYIWRGKQLGSLSQQELTLLEPGERRNGKTNKALLLLHGFSSSPAVYRYLIPQIKNYDAIISPLLSGHGDSIQTFSQAKAADWLLSAETSCQRLINEFQQVDVLGLSLGGLLACELSRRFQLNHLYLLAPALKLHMSTKRMLKLARFLKKTGFIQLRNGAGNIISKEHAEIAYRRLPITTITEMLILADEYQWVPPNCPVDLFLGQDDLVVDSKKVEALFSPLANTTIHWLTHSAHVLPLDNDLDKIVECINKG